VDGSVQEVEVSKKRMKKMTKQADEAKMKNRENEEENVE
jgi:hypothetical protein